MEGQEGNVAENDGLSTIALLTGMSPSFAEAPPFSHPTGKANRCCRERAEDQGAGFAGNRRRGETEG